MPRLRSGREGLDQQIHLDVGEGTSSKQKKTRPPIENVAGLSEQQKLSSIMGEMAFPGREETNPSKSSIDRLVAKAKMLELALEKAKSDDNTNTQLIEDLNTICEFKDNKLIEAAVSRIVDRTGEHKDPSINRAIRFIKMRHMVRDVDDAGDIAQKKQLFFNTIPDDFFTELHKKVTRRALPRAIDGRLNIAIRDACSSIKSFRGIVGVSQAPQAQRRLGEITEDMAIEAAIGLRNTLNKEFRDEKHIESFRDEINRYYREAELS